MQIDDNVTAIPHDTDAMRRLRAHKQAKRVGRFVKGPIRWPWLTTAAKCHPRAIEILLAAKMQSDTTGKVEVTLSKTIVADLGISRDTVNRALAALEKAGLVSVERRRGRLPRIRLA